MAATPQLIEHLELETAIGQVSKQKKSNRKSLEADTKLLRGCDHVGTVCGDQHWIRTRSYNSIESLALVIFSPHTIISDVSNKYSTMSTINNLNDNNNFKSSFIKND